MRLGCETNSEQLWAVCCGQDPQTPLVCAVRGQSTARGPLDSRQVLHALLCTQQQPGSC